MRKLAVIKRDSGCRVGWLWFDNEAEARECAAVQRERGKAMVAEGYDFGYVFPGGVESTEVDGQPAWKVITT